LTADGGISEAVRGSSDEVGDLGRSQRSIDPGQSFLGPVDVTLYAVDVTLDAVNAPSTRVKLFGDAVDVTLNEVYVT
jgi:hypothetical protein